MSDEIGRFTQVLRRLIVYVVIVVVIAAGDLLGVVGPVRGMLEWSVSAAQAPVGNVIELMQQPVEAVIYWRTGARRMADLEQRLTELSVDYTRLQELEYENQQLRAVKGIVDDTGGNQMVFGRILQSPGLMSVNAGSEDGVITGMVAVDGQGVLVGLVTAVSKHVSRIDIPSDQGVRIGVRVVGEKTTGVLLGDGKRAVVTEVLQDEPLAAGDVLVTSGTDGIYPEGLVVGQVTELTGLAADVTKGGMVELLGKADETVLLY